MRAGGLDCNSPLTLTLSPEYGGEGTRGNNAGVSDNVDGFLGVSTIGSHEDEAIGVCG